MGEYYTLGHITNQALILPELKDTQKCANGLSLFIYGVTPIPQHRLASTDQTAIPVAVSAVRPSTAQLVGLGVHHGVHDLLGEPAKQLLHVDGAVVETGHGEHVRRRV